MKKTYEAKWNTIKWPQVERYVFRLQKQIYEASQKRDIPKIRYYQRILLGSWQAKLLATRRVTQDNTGKKTAGVDGIKSIKPEARYDLAMELKLGEKTKPVKRVWIPKPGTEEKRPLGIPTMKDRALQALVKLGIEPEWEGVFEPNSYGFRPGRGCHDAIKQIIVSIQSKPKYVLDADIAKCFDRINHERLLEKMGYEGKMRQQIKSWLKSGVMDDGVFERTEVGTPQGGVISPLLANIALHGLEEKLKEHISSRNPPLRYTNGKVMSRRDRRNTLAVIRYADDFVVMHSSLEVVKECKEILTTWLGEMGLKLHTEKTRIIHTLNEIQTEGSNEQTGFDFLGFTIKQYRTKYHSATRHKKTMEDFRTLVYPSKKTLKNHAKRLTKYIQDARHWSQKDLINGLNPIITGWTNYFALSDGSTTRTFSKMDNLMYLKLRSWAKKRHGTAYKAYHGNWKYRSNANNGRVEFGIYDEGKWTSLKYHRDIASGKSITRYIKVKGEESPYNGKMLYWATRLGNNLYIKPSQAKLLKRQKGKCNYCQQYFQPNDKIETDHIKPKFLITKDMDQVKTRDQYKNLQLLHKHCHDNKSRIDAKARKTVTE